MIINQLCKCEIKFSKYFVSDVNYDSDEELDFDEDIEFDDDDNFDEDDDLQILDFENDGAETRGGYYPYFRSGSPRFDDEY